NLGSAALPNLPMCDWPMVKVVECPNCFHKVRIDPALTRDAVKCLKCGQTFSAVDDVQAAAYSLAVQPCPSCRKDCAPDVVMCIECGYDFKTRKRHRTRHEPFHATWCSALSFGTRLLAFAVLELLCLAGFLFGWKIGLLVFAVATVAGALYFGTIRRITLSRSPEGKVLLRVRRSYAFFPCVDQSFN